MNFNKTGKVITSESVGTGPSSYEGKVITSESVGTGPSSYEKGTYGAAVS
jgi:hypothetical protein